MGLVLVAVDFNEVVAVDVTVVSAVVVEMLLYPYW